MVEMVENLSIDVVIFLAYIFFNLIAGIFFSGGVKSFREYAVGDKKLSTPALIATIVATTIGGGFFSGAIIESYKQGLYFIIPAIGEPVGAMVIGYFFVPRMIEFMDKLSIADAMGTIYGRNVRVIVALASVFLCLGMVSLQFKVSSSLLAVFLGVSSFYAVLISAVIVIIYASFGGIKAVTFTDIIQFLTFGTIVPIISFAIWGSIGDPWKVFSLIETSPKFNLSEIFNITSPHFIHFVLLFLFFLGPEVQPVDFQRIVMAKDVVQARKSFITAGVIAICILLIVSWVGVLLLADNPDLDANQLLPYMLDKYSYPGLKGLTAIGIIAIVMSTADSYINAASVLISNDILKQFKIGDRINKYVGDISLARIVAVIIGISAFILAFRAESILELLIFILEFYSPVITAPLILSIFGFRTSSKVILLGIAAGLGTVISLHVFDLGVDGVVPGLLMNLATILFCHYISGSKGGWQGIKDDSALQEIRAHRKYWLSRLFYNIKNFNIIKFVISNSPKREYIFSFFGLFAIISVCSSLYSIYPVVREQHSSLLTIMYDSVLLSTTVFLTYIAWPSSFKSKKIIASFWIFAVPIILIFAPTILVFVSNFNQFQMMLLIINMIVLSILFRWQIALVMIIASIFSAVKCYEIYTSIAFIEQIGNLGLQFKMMYLLILFSAVLICFLKPQQDQRYLDQIRIDHLDSELTFRRQEMNQLIDMKNEFLRNIEHESKTPITGIASMGQVLYENYHNLNKDQVESGLKEIAHSSEKLLSWSNNLIDLSRFAAKQIKIKIEKINLNNLIDSRVQICRRIYLDSNSNSSVRVSLNLDDLNMNGDAYLLSRLVDNLVINAIQYSDNGNIKISLKKRDGDVLFKIEDQGIGIDPKELYDIFGAFTVSKKTKSIAGGRGVGLALSKKIVELHKGQIWAESDGKTGSTFFFSLPLE